MHRLIWSISSTKPSDEGRQAILDCEPRKRLHRRHLQTRPTPEMNRLDNAVRTSYRTALAEALADGRAKPLLIPYSLLGAFIVPMLWLTIPHSRRPWLYQTRWLVMAFAVIFNVNVALYSSSTNMACAYAAGLMATWGTISSLNLIIWKRPQFEAARAVKVPRVPEEKGTNGAAGQGTGSLNQEGPRMRKSEGVAAVSKVEELAEDDDKEMWVWQPFPAEASFLERFGWVLDLTCSFRASGESLRLVRRQELEARVHY